jgi:uncharacterized protein YjbJ (UPF0337 family)
VHLALFKQKEVFTMTDSSTRDRAEGMFDQGKGKVKQGVGDLTDNEQMQGEGTVDELKGKGKQAVGDLKDAAGDMKDTLERKAR